MNIQLVRHATLLVEAAGIRIAVDPMFSPKEAMAATPNTANDRRNPLVDLPFSAEAIFPLDAIMVTHSHRDHFDEEAAKLLPKQIPLFCQPQDEEKFKALDFGQVLPVFEAITWHDLKISRTAGRHGTGEIGEKMGPVCGFVIESAAEPTLYIAGDSIWCEDVEAALDKFTPEITVVNAGAAQLLIGDPITMTAEDIRQVCTHLPSTKVIAVHMDSWNHCLLTRSELQSYLANRHLQDQVIVPQDGERMVFN